MNEFCELTIVIPTYNKRWGYVLRNCEYWKGTGANIVVLDQSDDCFLYSTKHSLPPNVRYVHCPGKSYIERLKISLGYIDTKYALMNNDDDIKFKNVVGRCIDELEQNSELVACNGVYSHFSYWHNKIYALPEVSFYNGGCLGDCLRTERLLNSAKTLFTDGVFRSGVYESCVKALFEVPSPSNFVFTFQFVAAYHGKWKQLDELMWMRSYESPAACSRHGVSRSLFLYQWFQEKKDQDEIANWITMVVNNLSHDTGDDPTQIKEDFLTALNAWCEAERSQEIEGAVVGSRIAIWRRKILLLLPHRLLRIFRSLRYKIPAGEPIQIQLNWLECQGVSVDLTNISELSGVLKKHYSV